MRGLLQLGKLKIVEDELGRYNMDVCGIAETHYNQFRFFQATEYKVYCSSCNDILKRGIAILVAKRWPNVVIWYNIVSLKMNLKPFNVHLIQIYAPTEDTDKINIAAFYTDLEQ